MRVEAKKLNIIVLNGYKEDNGQYEPIDNQGYNMIVYATNQYAYERGKAKDTHTLFTEQLLKNIMRPELDVRELFDLTKHLVTENSKGHQVPVPIIASHNIDGVYLGEKPAWYEKGKLAVITDAPGKLEIWKNSNRKKPVKTCKLGGNEWKYIELPLGTYIVRMSYQNAGQVTSPKVSVDKSNPAGIKFIKNNGNNKQLPGCYEKNFIAVCWLFLAGMILSCGRKDGGNGGLIAIVLPKPEKDRWQKDAETLRIHAKSKGYEVYSSEYTRKYSQDNKDNKDSNYKENLYKEQGDQNRVISDFLDHTPEKNKALIVAPVNPADEELKKMVEQAKENRLVR